MCKFVCQLVGWSVRVKCFYFLANKEVLKPSIVALLVEGKPVRLVF